MLLSGCGEVKSQPKGSASLLGYDIEDKTHIVTLSVLYQTESGGEPEIKVYSAKGISPENALKILNQRNGDKFLWGGLQCILIGQDAAITNTIDILELLESAGNIGPKTPLVLTSQKASEVITGDEKPAEAMDIISTIENSVATQTTVESTLFSAIKGHREPLKNSLITIIHQDDDKNLFAEGAGIIYDGELIGLLDSRVTAAVNWLRSEDGEYHVNILSDRIGTFSGLLKNAKTSIKPMQTKDGLRFVVEVSLDAQLEPNGQELGQEVLAEMGNEIQKEAEQMVGEALGLTVLEYDRDLFGFTKRLTSWNSFRGEKLPERPIKDYPIAINVKVSLGSWR